MARNKRNINFNTNNTSKQPNNSLENENFNFKDMTEEEYVSLSEEIKNELAIIIKKGK